MAYASLIVALSIVWVAYERFGFRAVSLSIPLLASFSSLMPESIPVIIVSSITSYLVGELAYRKFLFYGMRMFFLQSIISSVTVLITTLNSLSIEYLLISTLPGLLSYDIHTSREPVLTAAFSAIFFTLQLFVTSILVNFLKV
ncbi:MAG: hypothetical protein QI197_04995 [Candidatus Korarchaeota archaeon]|nr:hypothetical protein [Candidatus Korarchaeota archaeon]